MNLKLAALLVIATASAQSFALPTDTEPGSEFLVNSTTTESQNELALKDMMADFKVRMQRLGRQVNHGARVALNDTHKTVQTVGQSVREHATKFRQDAGYQLQRLRNHYALNDSDSKAIDTRVLKPEDTPTIIVNGTTVTIVQSYNATLPRKTNGTHSKAVEKSSSSSDESEDAKAKQSPVENTILVTKKSNDTGIKAFTEFYDPELDAVVDDGVDDFLLPLDALPIDD